MYCFRCGKKIPPGVINCPECATPQKRRQRYRTRMILGLFIFLAGAVAGSLFDNFFFRGKAWEHNITDLIEPATRNEPENTHKVIVASVSKEIETIELSADASEMYASETVEVGQIEEAASDAATEAVPLVETVEEQADVATGTEAHESAQKAEFALQTAVKPMGPIKFTNVEVLVKDKAASYHGSLSKDQQELVFASDRDKVNGSRKYQCFVKKTVGNAEPEKLFSWPGNVWTPELTPDRKKVVFSSDSRKYEHIFVYNRETKESKALTDGITKNMMPAISPDGTLIAFVSNEKGNNDIWLVGLDGSNKIQITDSPEDDREPRWLADGEGLVFTRIFDRLKKSHIMKVVLEPLSAPVTIVDDHSRNWLADMSPDGRHLAFVRSLSGDGSKNTIFVKDLQTGQETAVKPLGDAECFRPVWVSDGRSFVFHANIERSKNIYRAYFSAESQD